MGFARGCAATLLWLTLGPGGPTDLDGQGDGGDDVAATVGVLAAGAGVLGLGVFDIATAPRSARRYNENSLAIRPLFDPEPGRYGLAFSVSAGQWVRADALRNAGGRSPRGLSQTAKSAGVATLWSLGATLIPSGIGLALAGGGGWNDNQTTLAIGVVGMVGGWVFGPSAGHWYAEQRGRAWATTGIRAGLLVLGLLALSTISFD